MTKMRRHPDLLLRMILIWTALTALVVWLPLVRGLFGGTTDVWHPLPSVVGQGLEGQYWFLVVVATFVICLLYVGWRSGAFPFHMMLLLWHLPLAFGTIYFGITQSDGFRLRGDVPEVNMSLALWGPILVGGMAVLALVWVVRDRRSGQLRRVPAWAAPNRVLLLISGLLVPLQFFLFRMGGISHSEQAGALVTVLQWILLNAALAPWEGQGSRYGRKSMFR